MLNIFDAENNIEAHMIVHFLTRSGIEAQIMGEHLQGGVGELPAQGNIRVVVNEADATEARRVISDWEAIQVPANVETPESVRKGTYSGFVGLLAGGAIASAFLLWVYNSPIDSESADYDGDGVPEEIYHWRGGFVTLIEGDRNGDRKIDLKYHNSRRLGIDSAESDDDFNGTFEFQAKFKHSKIISDSYDINDDGLPDRKYFYEDGVLVRSEMFHPSRRYIRKREDYEHGLLRSAQWDSDDDETLETSIEYGVYGEELLRHDVSEDTP